MAEDTKTSYPKSVPWRGGLDDAEWGEKRPCPFVIEIKFDDEHHDLTCQGSRVLSVGGPAICAYMMTDSERGDACQHWYHMCEVPVELATNCCWAFQMLIAGCVTFRTSYGKKQQYFAIRRQDWDKDVHRCYEEPTFRFCPYCGAEIKWKTGEW